MKKLICLCLALAVIFALMSGCKKEINIGQPEPTTVPVNDADLNNAAGLLGEDLDADAMEALRRMLEGGVDPSLLQAPETPPETMPPPMPTGVETDAAESRALIRKVLEILDSGKFMMKTRSSSSPLAMGGNTATPLTVAVQDNAMAFEMEMDWIALFRSQGQGVMASINGASAQSMFGKKLRVITKSDGIVIAFPDKKMYMPMGNGSEEGGEALDFDMSAIFGESFGGGKDPAELEEKLNGVKSSKVTANGKEYLCAEVTTNNLDGTSTPIRYYFLGGELKRIETEADGESFMSEIDMFTGTVDPAFFSTAGMRVMPLDQLTEMGGNFADLFGGVPATAATSAPAAE